MLRDRADECAALDQLLHAVRHGDSGALVLRGEPGVGKTALLDYIAESARDLRVARAAGFESEMELAFAGLHQLCAPILDRLERLPGPQRDALKTAFGLSGGDPPDRFFVGLAVLSLLAEVAQDQPLVCLVDDAQWLDQASAQALAFVARRLAAESVALVFAVRESGMELAELPELRVSGLRDGEARALLASVIRGPLDHRVRDRIVAETRGNPLALLELPRGSTSAELAGGFGLPGALSGHIEASFLRRFETLPPASQRLSLIAAAEPLGEPTLVWRAAERLGIERGAATPTTAAGLLEFGARVRFRHPLVRSAVYEAASPEERQSVHRALADATDGEVDPDRRAWHRAQGAPGPDEQIADELERSADRAQARGGLSAAAAFLEKAAQLTLEPARRTQRALAAAQAKHQAGASEAALGLLATAEAGPLDQFQHAQLYLLRAQLRFASSRGSDAPSLLLKAAQQLEAFDVGLARETHLDALTAAIYVGRLADGAGLLQVARAARAAPPSVAPPRATDLLLDGLALLITDGYAAGTPMLQRAVSAFRNEDLSGQEALSRLWLACHVAHDLWDDEAWRALSGRHVELGRNAGALFVLPIALSTRIGAHLHAGEFAEAAALVEELEVITEATGNHLPPFGALALAGWQGRDTETSRLIEASMSGVMSRGEGMGLTIIQYTSAVLNNGLGRYEEALAAAELASTLPEELAFSTWSLVELIEAAVRSGKAERAGNALERLSETTRAGGTDWGLGIEARSRALLSVGGDAEALYREAIERLGRSCGAMALARAHLVYGEWLRRERRRLDAREQLRTAHEMFAEFGADAFAQRAERELLATGEHARKRTVETSDELTAQEALIARLARDGLSNPDIGARLFISPRTVEYHLHKVFAKLGIGSRNELDGVVPADEDGDGTAALRRS